MNWKEVKLAMKMMEGFEIGWKKMRNGWRLVVYGKAVGGSGR